MAKLIQFTIHNQKELVGIVDFLAEYLQPKTLFLLDGPMAAGKTTLISELLKKKNIPQVHSPTYALHHQYNSSEIIIHHLDLHRLTTDDEIESSGLWDLLNSTQDVFFIEWAKNISRDQWPLEYHIIEIEILNLGADSRQFKITVN